MLKAKQDLDARRVTKTHILVITDGENTTGYDPADVVSAIYRLPEVQQTSTYFIAFNVSAEVFEPVREAGGMVLSASNDSELATTLDYLLTGRILAEQPIP